MTVPIALVIDEPVPDKPGCVRVKEGHSLAWIRREIVSELRSLPGPNEDYPTLYDTLDYLSVAVDKEYADKECRWPKDWRWIACFAVTGGSEGYYVHVEVLDRDDKRELMFLAKTFAGMDVACQLANALTVMLGA